MSEANHRPNPDLLDRAAAELRQAPVPPGPSRDLVTATLAALDARQAPPAPRRRLVRYLRYGTAAAAAVLVLALAALPWFGGGAGSAFARTLDSVQRARSVVFDETERLGDQPEVATRNYLQGDHVRVEIAGGTNVLILDTGRRRGLMLVPPLKAARVLAADQIHGAGGQTPLDGLLALQGQRSVAAGEEVIDGRRTRVVRVPGGKWAGAVGDWTVWIDPRTDLPVKIRVERTDMAPKVTKTLTHFSWNVPLDPKLFDLDVPPGYRLGFPGERDAGKKK